MHAYLYPTGYPPWVLIEGAAVALSCTSRFYATSKPAMTWDQLASVQSGAIDPVSAHSAGAWLASYLLDQFGAAPFLETCRSVSHDASAADMTAAFQRIYGASLATLWASAWSEDQPRNTGLWQCSRPPMALDGTAVDSDGTCGPDITRPFTLASEVTISFTTTSADISLGPCRAGDRPGRWAERRLARRVARPLPFAVMIACSLHGVAGRVVLQRPLTNRACV